MKTLYDHRLKELVFASTDPYQLIKGFGVPLSTAAAWTKNKPRKVVTFENLDVSKAELIKDINKLQLECKQLTALLELYKSINDIFGFSIKWQRLPSAADKELVLKMIKKTASITGLKKSLATISLSSSRYHSWVKRDLSCNLNDYKTCPKFNPMKLTAAELTKMKDFVTSADYAHYPLTTLAKKIKRSGQLICSPSTWSRMVKRHGWKRPRRRVYPTKPKIGVRANAPNEIWHVDVTEVNLLEGGKAYVQSVVDNYSRYTIAWKVSEHKTGCQTKDLLLEALEKASNSNPKILPEVFVDGGSENFNQFVSKLVNLGKLTLTNAQIDVKFSNSIIEANFRSLKYNCLYNVPLQNINTVRQLTDFYYSEQNSKMPHSAFKGATPEEMYRGLWSEEIAAELKEKSRAAIKNRISFHQSLNCNKCLS